MKKPRRSALVALFASSAATLAQPVSIHLWYGGEQEFGRLGTPQRWVNLLGRVEGAAQSLTYSLNGGPERPLTLGPNDTRLAAAGDFNAEIDYRELRAGRNTVVLTANGKAGGRARKRVVLRYTPNRFWPLPYEIDWRTVARISDAAQVVDGEWDEWELTRDGVRTRRPYYDRVLAIGDLTWRDYEAAVEVTIHAFTDPKPGPPTYNVSHAGIGLRWQGHQDDGQQPRVQWYPLGAATEFQLFPDLTRCHWRILPGRDSGPTVSAQRLFSFELNRKHIMRALVERQPDGKSRYCAKIWRADDPEPPAWDVEALEGAGDLQHGCLLLVAHNADVTFGRVQVTGPGRQPAAGWDKLAR